MTLFLAGLVVGLSLVKLHDLATIAYARWLWRHGR